MSEIQQMLEILAINHNSGMMVPIVLEFTNAIHLNFRQSTLEFEFGQYTVPL